MKTPKSPQKWRQMVLRKKAGARYTKWTASLELRHKKHNNDPYPLHNNTIDFDNGAYWLGISSIAQKKGKITNFILFIAFQSHKKQTVVSTRFFFNKVDVKC